MALELDIAKVEKIYSALLEAKEFYDGMKDIFGSFNLTPKSDKPLHAVPVLSMSYIKGGSIEETIKGPEVSFRRKIEESISYPDMTLFKLVDKELKVASYNFGLLEPIEEFKKYLDQMQRKLENGERLFCKKDFQDYEIHSAEEFLDILRDKDSIIRYATNAIFSSGMQ